MIFIGNFYGLCHTMCGMDFFLLSSLNSGESDGELVEEEKMAQVDDFKGDIQTTCLLSTLNLIFISIFFG